jgi:subtilisin family serine protease
LLTVGDLSSGFDWSTSISEPAAYFAAPHAAPLVSLWFEAQEALPTGGSQEPVDSPAFDNDDNWNLRAIHASEAWATGHSGSGVVVAVIDSGIDASHPDLGGKIWVNRGEVAGNQRDDDGNGFVDDVSGWDFVSGDNLPTDTNGHGTHVAGAIAANGAMTGVAPGATLMPVRVLDGNIHGSNGDIAAGIRYATNNGADIINLSLGGSESPTVFAALEYALAHDVLVVAAAGNGRAAAPTYPAAYSAQLDNVLSVGAFRSSGDIANFTSAVGDSGAVQVDAPGANIRSTFVTAPYGYQSGTSMAAPHASGIAALALSANPNLTAPQLRSVIVQAAERHISGSDSRGAVNAARAVALAVSARPTETAPMLAAPIVRQPHAEHSTATRTVAIPTVRTPTNVRDTPTTPSVIRPTQIIAWQPHPVASNSYARQLSRDGVDLALTKLSREDYQLAWPSSAREYLLTRADRQLARTTHRSDSIDWLSDLFEHKRDWPTTNFADS